MTAQPINIYKGDFYKLRQERTFVSANKILGIIKKYHKFNSMIDFGCGVGTWLRAAEALGVKELEGYEGEWAREHITGKALNIHFQDFESAFKVNNQFDLAISLEVAEHLTPKAGHMLIKTMCTTSKVILFSAAIPGQGGVGHINEQPQNYWLEIFSKFGFQPLDFIRPRIWDNANIPLWYKQNALIYTSDKQLYEKLNKKTLPIINIVHPESYQIALNPGIKTSIQNVLKLPHKVFKRYFNS